METDSRIRTGISIVRVPATTAAQGKRQPLGPILADKWPFNSFPPIRATHFLTLTVIMTLREPCEAFISRTRVLASAPISGVLALWSIPERQLSQRQLPFRITGAIRLPMSLRRG